MSRGWRRKDSYKRRRVTREPRETILIVCHGKTEKMYFEVIKNELGLSTFEVKVIDQGATAITLVKEAIDIRDLRRQDSVYADFDEIWCVTDVEVPKKDTSLEAAMTLAENENILLALSNPCFEFWYILHYKKSAPGFSFNRQAKEELKKYFPSYTKSEDDICHDVYPKIGDAIKWAQELENEQGWTSDLRKHNPSTHVYKVVEKLIKISKM